MRIAYFAHAYPSATYTFIEREISGLRKRGFDIRTFSVRRTGAEHDVSPEILEAKRRTFYLLSVGLLGIVSRNISALLAMPIRYFETLVMAWKTSRPGLRGHLYQLFYFQEAVILAAELRRNRIEHLHAHLGDVSGTVAMLASRLSDVGYSITFHGPHIFFDPTHWGLREKVKHSRFVVSISQFCNSQLMLFSDRVDWVRLEVVHCGVNLEQYPIATPARQARNLLFVGRLAVEKGLPVLFKSLELLMKQGYEFKLTLLGDGQDRETLRSMAQEMGIHDRVEFAGYVSADQVAEYLRRSDAFVLPSFAEGVPVSLMEAMAVGVPVVGTYVGGVAELVENGRTGQVVAPGDHVALSDAIATYLDDYELREKVSKLGREKVATQFNLNAQVDRLASLFRSHAGAWRL